MKKWSVVFYCLLAAAACAKPNSDQAPSFQLADTGGRVVSLSDLKGKVVLLNFWATWCESCKEEMPILETLYRRHHGKDFELLAASVDAGGRKAVLSYLARYEYSFPILMADAKTIRGYGVSGLPASFLIDSSGRIVRRYAGPVDFKGLENDILEQIRENE